MKHFCLGIANTWDIFKTILLINDILSKLEYNSCQSDYDVTLKPDILFILWTDSLSQTCSILIDVFKYVVH
jgi:hypothetical protein